MNGNRQCHRKITVHIEAQITTAWRILNLLSSSEFSRKTQTEANGFDRMDMEIPVLIRPIGKPAVIVGVQGVVEISDVGIISVQYIEYFRRET